MARELGNTFVLGAPLERLAFLPAERTALDFGNFGWGRMGALLIEHEGGALGHMVHAEKTGAYLINPRAFWLGLSENASNSYRTSDPSDAAQQALGRMVPMIYGALALINTPRLIGRRQHMPHAGLQRRLAAERGMVGKFPLRGWTEIVLEVTPPIIADEQMHEARLTGGRCLHFCREHLRIVGGVVVTINGRREVIGGKETKVKAHWRGDAALGIKRTRYRLEAPT